VARLEPDSGQEGTAFHEAGHAVVAHRLGYPLGGVSIDSQIEGKLGHSASDVLPNRLKEITDWRRENLSEAEWKAAWHDVVIYLAGASAEAEYKGDAFMPDPDVPQSSDEEEVLGRLRRMYRDYRTENERLQVAVTEARDLVRKYWTEIDALARALLRQETMTAAEVIAAIRRSES
jgi:hypothetical protein